MRYTASAAMEDRTLRDVERWKDKIEIRLDNRQVFFLFFGSALVACLLFILGVVVGKRLESRGRAATPEIEDPLALLDRIAAAPGTPDESITFPRALIQAPAGKPGKAEGKAKSVALAPKLEPVPTKQETKPEAKAEAKPEPRTEPKAEPPAPVAAKPAAPEAKPAAVPAPPAPKTVPAKPAQTVAVMEKPAAKTPDTAANDKKGKFTLQLGSFQSKEEADAFMAKFASASPFVVVSDIPDKGRWYRVRVGNYASAEEAMAAKSEFERTHHQIAYVAPR